MVLLTCWKIRTAHYSWLRCLATLACTIFVFANHFKPGVLDLLLDWHTRRAGWAGSMLLWTHERREWASRHRSATSGKPVPRWLLGILIACRL